MRVTAWPQTRVVDIANAHTLPGQTRSTSATAPITSAPAATSSFVRFFPAAVMTLCSPLLSGETVRDCVRRTGDDPVTTARRRDWRLRPAPCASIIAPHGRTARRRDGEVAGAALRPAVPGPGRALLSGPL